MEIQVDDRLKEISTGVFENRLWPEVEAEHPEAVVRWKSGDPDFSIPGGESRNQLARRGEEVFREIARSNYDRVAVVAHGGLLVYSLKLMLGIPFHEAPLTLENGSITQFSLDEREFAELALLDSVDHMSGLQSDGAKIIL